MANQILVSPIVNVGGKECDVRTFLSTHPTNSTFTILEVASAFGVDTIDALTLMEQMYPFAWIGWAPKEVGPDIPGYIIKGQYQPESMVKIGKDGETKVVPREEIAPEALTVFGWRILEEYILSPEFQG